jgi:hypothetical protein
MFDRKTVQNFKMASILSGSIFQLHCMHTLAYFEQRITSISYLN